MTTTPAQPTTAALRALAEAATPGPWSPLTHGTASQRDAAGRAYEAVMARSDPDSPDIEFTDLSWVEAEDDLHVALVGNGPRGSENAKYIAAVDPQTVLTLLNTIDALEQESIAATARAERAEAVVAAARMVLAVWPNIVNHPRLHNSEIDALAAALDALSGAERP